MEGLSNPFSQSPAFFSFFRRRKPSADIPLAGRFSRGRNRMLREPCRRSSAESRTVGISAVSRWVGANTARRYRA